MTEGGIEERPLCGWSNDPQKNLTRQNRLLFYKCKVGDVYLAKSNISPVTIYPIVSS
jgi:hypothetical protein